MEDMSDKLEDALMGIDYLESEVSSLKKENKNLKELIFQLAEENNLVNPFE